MTPFSSLFQLILVLILFISTSAEAQSKRYILKGADLNDVASTITKEGGIVSHRMHSLRAIVAHVSEQSLRGLIHKNPNLQAIEDIELSINARPSKEAATAPSQKVPWGINMIHAQEANLYNRGAGVKVCVVDTGVDKTHSDLATNIAGGKNFVWAKGKLNSTAYGDDNGHGTHVSGTIAALDNGIGVIGVAPAAKIYAVKVLNSRGNGYLSDITDGIYECIAQGTQVINMSLGGQGDPNANSPFRDAVTAARNAGIIVVVAAGNEGQDISNTVPAGFSNVIAVSAVDSSLHFPSWSNFGLNGNDFAAPGVSITSTWKRNTYNTISGTSMASPHVAGVAALLVSSGSLGFMADDIGAPISQQGAGLVNALATVQNK